MEYLWSPLHPTHCRPPHRSWCWWWCYCRCRLKFACFVFDLILHFMRWCIIYVSFRFDVFVLIFPMFRVICLRFWLSLFMFLLLCLCVCSFISVFLLFVFFYLKTEVSCQVHHFIQQLSLLIRHSNHSFDALPIWEVELINSIHVLWNNADLRLTRMRLAGTM